MDEVDRLSRPLLRRCHVRDTLRFLPIDQKTHPLDALDPLIIDGPTGGVTFFFD